MPASPPADDYALLDSGAGRKLERFGAVILARPAAQAVWRPARPETEWRHATASFDRENGLQWRNRDALPEDWVIRVAGLAFRLSGTDFGHLGIFPEQRDQWRWIAAQTRALVRKIGRRPVVLNLFAYSGGATLAAAQAGAEVCHLDASKGMVAWARENAALNGLRDAPIRWIVDDAHKFLAREERRGRRYDGIILDPPSFGRGSQGELYKIERDLPDTLDRCRALLTEPPGFLLLSAHTPGLSAIVLRNLVDQTLRGCGGASACGEMLLTGERGVAPLPNGAWARWAAEAGAAEAEA